MVNFTKKAIADSFMKLLNKYPFDKITVKDIVEDCGVNRNTFYYHYHDIYDLLEEILETERKRVEESQNDYESWQQAILETASFAFANKRAIYHLYNSISRRQTEGYITMVAERAIKTYVAYKTRGRQVKEEALAMIILFYKSAAVGMILQWLDSNMKVDAEEIIQKMGVLVEGTIEVMLQNAESSAFKEAGEH